MEERGGSGPRGPGPGPPSGVPTHGHLPVPMQMGAVHSLYIPKPVVVSAHRHRIGACFRQAVGLSPGSVCHVSSALSLVRKRRNLWVTRTARDDRRHVPAPFDKGLHQSSKAWNLDRLLLWSKYRGLV